MTAKAADFSAAKDRCDVRIGACTVAGDLRDYAVHYEDGEVSADLRLHGTVPSWRPGTGHAFFDEERFFAWLPSVPRGTVEGTVSIGGATRSVTGVGYHDHNWGNAALPGLVHNWYWGRARIGDYTVIASFITATDRYGGTALPVFMLARGDAIVADDAAKVRFSADEVFTDPLTGKPVAGRLVYEYDDGTGRYRITFRRAADLARTKFVDLLTGFKRFLARLAVLRRRLPPVRGNGDAGAVRGRPGRRDGQPGFRGLGADVLRPRAPLSRAPVKSLLQHPDRDGAA